MGFPSTSLRLLVLLIVAVFFAHVDATYPPRMTVEQQIKAHIQKVQGIINTAAHAPDQTAAIKATIAPLFAKDVVWTITSGVDTKAPTLEWVGTDSHLFYTGFKIIMTQSPVTFKVVNVFPVNDRAAVYKFLVFSPKCPSKPIEIVTAYSVKIKENTWVSQLMTVSQYRN